jgi:aerobic carbon-monoxide dehydrogenase small subunit
MSGSVASAADTRTTVSLKVNGRDRVLNVDNRTILTELLREHLQLTGVHIGCSTGNCGACTVLLDGKTVKSCCVIAADVEGQEVTTIEAFSTGIDDLHPIQQAFVEKQGLQCGYCTPAMVLSAHYLLEQNPNPTEEEIRHGIAGNLCRCTGYQFIVESIQEAARKLAAGGKGDRVV